MTAKATNRKQLKDFDPIESKKRKKQNLDKFDPSRKNKKHYLKNYNEYV